MANFDRSGMTRAGINLMGKAVGGATIQFTRLVLGDGEMKGEILDLQGVVSPKQNVDVTRIERNDNQCTVGGELLTSSVKQGFFWRECGLYAIDPEQGEILYNYAYSTKPDFIAASDSGMMEEILVSMIATVGSNTNVDVTIDDSMVLTTKKEFEPIRSKVNHLNVDVKQFGAKGDGTTDDTQAFKDANDFLYTKHVITDEIYNQYRGVEIRTLEIPEGVYLIKGHEILGSTARTNKNTREIVLHFKGTGTIIWDILSEDDVLFQLDYTIQKVICEDINIVVINSSETIPVGGIVFNMYATQIDDTGRSKVTRSLFKNIEVIGGYTDDKQFPDKSLHYIKNVFKTSGYGMCDQVLVTHCEFVRFKTVFKCDNKESVNWTFDHCGFVSRLEDNIHFDFTDMFSNFNVCNSSFSFMCLNDTLLRTRILDSASQNLMQYEFNFDNNRMESQTSDTNKKLLICDMEFGVLNFSNSNLTLAAKAVIDNEIKVHRNAVARFDKVAFSRLNVYTTTTTMSTSDAVVLENCNCSTYNLFVLENGAQLTLPVALKKAIRGVVFKNFSDGLVNNIDYVFSNSINNSQNRTKRQYKYKYVQGVTCFGKTIYVPRFVNIKEINVYNMPSIPYEKIRLKVSAGNFETLIEKDIINYSTDNKYIVNVFKGDLAILATVSKDSHVINLVLVDGEGVEYGNIRGELELVYEELCTTNLSYEADGVYMKTYKNKEIAGLTSRRPKGIDIGYCWFDTSLKKPIWYDGTKWVDSLGADA